MPLKKTDRKSSRLGSPALTPWKAYAFAVVATSATLGVRLLLDERLEGQPALVIFTVPIMLSAYLGGLHGGLLATGLSFVAANYLLTLPAGIIGVTSGRWQEFLVAVAGVVVSVLNEAFHRARRRADAAVRQYQEVESELWRSEAGLQEAQRLAQIGSWEWESATDEVQASPELYHLFGLDGVTSIARFREQRATLYPIEDWEQVNAARQRSVDTGVGYDLTVRATKVGGPPLWIRTRGEAVRNASGTITGLRGTTQDITATHQAEAALEESEVRYRALVDWSPEPIAVYRHGVLIFVNPAAVAMFGATSTDALLGKSILDLMDPAFHATVMARMKATSEHGVSGPMIEIKAIKLDGTVMAVEVESIAIVYDGEPAILASLRDVSQRKAHEIEIERLNRLYSALGQINQAVVRMPTREELFQIVCRILVDDGGIHMAWVGWNDADTRILVPIARRGDAAGYLDQIQVYSDERPQGCGPSGSAFRTGRPYVSNDMFEDAATLPWREEIGRGGFQACAALPIRLSGEVHGVLNVYSIEKGFFKDKEIALLAEAASDISFALDNLAREAERQRSDAVALASGREASDLRNAIDQHALVVVADANGTITFVNDRFCEVSGYSREELLGNDHRLLNSGHHSKQFIRDLWTTIAHGGVWRGEFKNKAKNGTFYWVDTTIVPFLNADGTPRQYMAIRAVITERKEAELALRFERDRAQRYLDTAEVILLALDMAGRITMVNRHACSIFGWTEDELLGRDFIETCVPARIRDETLQKLSAVLTGPDSSVVENAIVTKSGEERMIEWRNTLQRDSDGRVVSTLSSGVDLTERNRTIAALRTTEERMRFALDSANVGIWDMDFTTGVLQWSEALEAQYGLDPGTFDGTFEGFVERIHPDDRASSLETVGTAMKAGTDFTTENRTIWPDGTVHSLSGAGRILLGANGEPVRGIGISQDVTERRTLEDQFRQAQKMEAIGQLAGGVAHDFNNLLTIILGYTQLLVTDLDPSDPHQEDLAEINRAGTAAAGLTRQLLAFSRKQIIEPTLLDLNDIVTQMRSMLGRLISEDVTILLELQPELAVIKADRAQVEQVIVNLAVNARDAMPTGGKLTIETANVELDEDHVKTRVSLKPGPYVRLTVSDTGTGMTPAVQARLFEPFFTTKEVGKGTGLGLATIHGIVARIGGGVHVYSELGIGTSFKVYFPRADVAAVEGVAAIPVTPIPAGAHTILVVEDANGLRELARRMLDAQGYTVFTAANAGEAIRLFEEHSSIDVLLTDVVMPGSSGPELSKRLTERRPGLKVLFMSGYTDDAIVQHGVLNAGVFLLNKPFTAESLGRKIREVLDS